MSRNCCRSSREAGPRRSPIPRSTSPCRDADDLTQAPRHGPCPRCSRWASRSPSATTAHRTPVRILGSGDMLEVAHMGLHVAQMTAHDAMRQFLRRWQEHPARILGLEGYGIAPGCKADWCCWCRRSGRGDPPARPPASGDASRQGDRAQCPGGGDPRAPWTPLRRSTARGLNQVVRRRA